MKNLNKLLRESSCFSKNKRQDSLQNRDGIIICVDAYNK